MLITHDAVFRTLAEISCASVNEQIHTSSSNCFEIGFFSFKNMSCVLGRNRNSSSKFPVALLIVTMSSTRNKRLLLSGSCERDDGVQLLLPFTCRLPSTHGRQPSNLRRLGTLCIGGMSSNARASWDEGCSPGFPTVCSSMALLMDPQAVKAQARFPRCSSVCGCITRFCPAKGTRMLLSHYLGDEPTGLTRFPHSES